MFSISVSALTFRAALIGGLAIVALLIVGWRKPARAEPRSPRWRQKTVPGIVVDHRPTHLHRRPGLAHRLASLATSGALAVLTGVLIGIIVSFAIAAAVTYLTDLLGS